MESLINFNANTAFYCLQKFCTDRTFDIAYVLLKALNFVANEACIVRY